MADDDKTNKPSNDVAADLKDQLMADEPVVNESKRPERPEDSMAKLVAEAIPDTKKDPRAVVGHGGPKGWRKVRKYLLIFGVIALIQVPVVIWLANDRAQAPASKNNTATPTPSPAPKAVSTETPNFKEEIIVQGRQNVWDVAQLPTGQLLFTERSGALNIYDNGKIKQVSAISDVRAKGEGGLMGLALDPQFSKNYYVYMCFNSTANDIRVSRWKLTVDLSSLTDRNELVNGIEANPSGRHSGCRLAFGPDGYLWIGTGDSAQGAQPQQPASLNGKILRVDREGKAVPGNMEPPFDPRIYSYGHRNTQGVAFFAKAKNGVLGISAEHGSTIDDEINPLSRGNFGWAPAAGYSETGVSMTDTTRFPDAVKAIWSSGEPTIAPSGAAIIQGEDWKGWNGAVALAILKDKYLKILRLDANNKITKEEKALDGTYGRLRAVTQGVDGNLYVTTDNSTNDAIIKLTPLE